MLYYLLYQLLYRTQGSGSESLFYKSLNVFQYISFRTALATFTSLLVTLLIGNVVIRKLVEHGMAETVFHHIKKGSDGKKKENTGTASTGTESSAQTADTGARKVAPEGTSSSERKFFKVKRATMGGVLVITSALVSTLVWAQLNSLYLWLTLGAMICFAAVGIVDDYLRTLDANRRGLHPGWRLLGMVLAVTVVWTGLVGTGFEWNLSVPFWKESATDPSLTSVGPFVYFAIVGLVLIGSSNAVKTTDRLDGFAPSLALIAATALTVLTYVSTDSKWANHLDITFRPGAADLTVFCGALVGSGLGFLWYNAPPGEIKLGSSGTFAVAAALGTVAIILKQEFTFLILMGVFVTECLSAVLQKRVEKITGRMRGRRYEAFPGRPIHRWLINSGVSETKIVFRYAIVGIFMALLALSTLKLR